MGTSVYGKTFELVLLAIIHFIPTTIEYTNNRCIFFEDSDFMPVVQV